MSVWEKDVWEFQAKSGRSGFCCLFLHFLKNCSSKKCLGERLEVPDILLPDIRGLLIFSWVLRKYRAICCKMGYRAVVSL